MKSVSSDAGSSQDGNSTSASQDGEGDQNARTSDYKNEDDILEAVQQIVEENATKDSNSGPDQEFRKEHDIQETNDFELKFGDKIGEITSKDEQPLHVFKQNVRFYQDREANTFNPRMIEFGIDIKGDHGKKIKKEKGKPGQEVFYLNYLNLC